MYWVHYVSDFSSVTNSQDLTDERYKIDVLKQLQIVKKKNYGKHCPRLKSKL